MGRAKLKLEFISKEKARMLTFRKRKQGLFTKLHQLTTLCDVNACMIIYGPKQQHGGIEPEIWPQNPEEVRRIIGLYEESKNRGSGSVNSRTTFGLSDFYHERKRRVEEEIVKLKRKNLEAKYPTRIELLSFLTEGELREFGALLKNKAEIVKSRIEFLKGNRSGLMTQIQSHDFAGVFHDSTAGTEDPGAFQIPMAAEQYYAPPVAPPQMHFWGRENYENVILQCAGGIGGVMPQPYLQFAGMNGVAPPLYVQCAGMDGAAQPLYLQCAEMGGAGPPQFPSAMEINYGLEDILFQYM